MIDYTLSKMVKPSDIKEKFYFMKALDNEAILIFPKENENISGIILGYTEEDYNNDKPFYEITGIYSSALIYYLNKNYEDIRAIDDEYTELIFYLNDGTRDEEEMSKAYTEILVHTIDVLKKRFEDDIEEDIEEEQKFFDYIYNKYKKE